jgi:hypothetical protein
MLPDQLTPESFHNYPDEARRLATDRLALLRNLPIGFVSLLLREVIAYDWKFPAERVDIDRQFAYLAALAPPQLDAAMKPFRELRLTETLERTDWVNGPATFSEQLTAHLWATHQIDAFRTAAVDYVKKSSAVAADPLPIHRLGIAVIGQGVRNNNYRLFRKLRPQGTYFTKLAPGDGLKEIVAAVAKRANAHAIPYAHWCLDGGAPPIDHPAIAQVSYAALAPARAVLQSKMQKIYEAPVFDPEAFRTTLAQTKPEELRLPAGSSPLMSRFQLSLLTEGSGTQVFATTFVQWAAREVLRRAQPLTIAVRFTPRQRENPMSELLTEAQRKPELDPQGSLIDADMGAYYTWLNQQRLAGAEKATFLAWFEDHSEAVAIGPGFGKNKQSDAPVHLRDLLQRLA